MHIKKKKLFSFFSLSLHLTNKFNNERSAVSWDFWTPVSDQYFKFFYWNRRRNQNLLLIKTFFPGKRFFKVKKCLKLMTIAHYNLPIGNILIFKKKHFGPKRLCLIFILIGFCLNKKAWKYLQKDVITTKKLADDLKKERKWSCHYNSILKSCYSPWHP